MNKTHRIIVLCMAIWLIACVIFSWAGILDDALIHLRYADNLLHTHRITYDGVHPSYGASSLLYVTILAILRSFTSSPNLPHILSTIVHLTLFFVLAALITKLTERRPLHVRIPGLIFLLLLIVPSAVRWLDDGMETGLILCFTLLICWFTFQQSGRAIIAPRYIGLVLLGFLAVMLRTELSLLCAISFAILTIKDVPADENRSIASWFKAAVRSSHLLLGVALALATILFTMHVLLPDTALAKSHGIGVWFNVLMNVPHAIGGGFTFGTGMLLLWLLTLLSLLRAGRLSFPLLLANSPFPVIVLLATMRGQEIQGVRYLIWTLVFSVFWNLLELITMPDQLSTERYTFDRNLSWALLALILMAQSIEIPRMFSILASRSRLMAMAPYQHLDVLRNKNGVASDVGVIGYFSKANICDTSGLVDGREFAKLTPDRRARICADSHPDFLYLNLYELVSYNQLTPVRDWQICDAFELYVADFKDVHYLILPPSTAKEICRETSGAQPYPVSRILGQ